MNLCNKRDTQSKCSWSPWLCFAPPGGWLQYSPTLGQTICHQLIKKLPSLADLIFIPLFLLKQTLSASLSLRQILSNFNFRLLLRFFYLSLSLSLCSTRSHGSASLLSEPIGAKSAQLRLHAESGHLWRPELCQGKHTRALSHRHAHALLELLNSQRTLQANWTTPGCKSLLINDQYFSFILFFWWRNKLKFHHPNCLYQLFEWTNESPWSSKGTKVQLEFDLLKMQSV